MTTEYGRQILTLLRESRVARETRRYVKGLPDTEVEAQLMDARLKARGHPFELRERLFRFIVRSHEPSLIVPWFDDYDANIEAEEAVKPLMCETLWGKYAKQKRVRKTVAPSVEDDSLSERLDAAALSEPHPRAELTLTPATIAASYPPLSTSVLTAVTTTWSTALSMLISTPAVTRPVMTQFAHNTVAWERALGRTQAGSMPRVTDTGAAARENASHIGQAFGLPGCVNNLFTERPPALDSAISDSSSCRSSVRDRAAGPRVGSSQSDADVKKEKAAKPAKTERRKSRYFPPSRQPSPSSSNDSEVESFTPARDAADRAQCARSMKDWNLKFAGDSKEDAEEFLAELEDYRLSSGYADVIILKALPVVLSKNARFWYRGARASLTSWRRFIRAFQDMYCNGLQEQDLEEELRRRTQGKGERIANYVACFQAIVAYFKNPPTMRRQIEMAYAQLRPEYRRFMSGKRVESFADMIKHGKEYERNKIWDDRFIDPPPKEKALIPGAAYAGARPRVSKVAAVTEVVAKPAKAKIKKENVSVISKPKEKKPESPPPRSRRTRRRRRRSRKSSSSSSSGAEEVAMLQRAPSQPASAKVQPMHTYAAVAKSHPHKHQAPHKVQSGVSMWSNAKAFPQHGWGRPATSLQPAYDARTQPRFVHQQAQTAANPFYGICYICQGVGHRAADCPKRSCYTCGQVGHSAQTCPWRQASTACQVCETPGVVFQNCPNCTTVRQYLENAKAGQQNRPLGPANSQ